MPKVATDAQGRPLEQNGQPVYEHRALLYVAGAQVAGRGGNASRGWEAAPDQQP